MSAIPHNFLRTLNKEVQAHPPIWFMRQAGRYLPEYRAVREEAGSFLDLCYTPDKAARVTMQPIERYDLDAAILFADILLVPQALGMDVSFQAGEGPLLKPALRMADHLPPLGERNIHDTLSPVYDTVRRVRAELPDEKALIGFAGAPWTVATYMIAGKGVKDPSALRLFAYKQPEAFQTVMRHLIDSTSDYLIEQVHAGADAIQLFDSWSGGLPQAFFQQWCVDPVLEIARRVKAVKNIPVIAFPRGSGVLYGSLASDDAIDAVSIDGSVPWAWAAENLSPHAVVQGGFDQLRVVAGGGSMIDEAKRLINAFDGVPYIFNLGHGFVPETPPEHVAELVTAIRAGK